MLLKPWPFGAGHAAIVVCISACVGAADQPRGPAPIFTDSIGRCDLSTGLPAPAESAAVRCAEWFVARNGYTASVPDDSVSLRGESIEMARSRRELLAERHRQLTGHAVLLCRSPRIGGYGVGIPYENLIGPDTGRLVTMDTTFSDLRVQHLRPLALDGATVVDGGCRRIGAARPGQ